MLEFIPRVVVAAKKGKSAIQGRVTQKLKMVIKIPNNLGKKNQEEATKGSSTVIIRRMVVS